MRQPNFIIVGLSVVFMVGLVLLIDSYKLGTPGADATLSLSEVVSYQEGSTHKPDPSRLRLAVASVLSPRATLENYHALAAYLGEKLGRPVDLVQSKSYAETNALVRSGDVSLALVCSGAFVLGQREFGMEALAVPVVDGERTYRSYLIVPSSSEVRSWEELRNKDFAFTDPLSNSGRLVPIYMLSRMGETPERFFKNFIFTYSHDNSIEAVAEGLVEGAAVDSLVYDFMARQDPSIAERTRVVWKSPPYGINPLVVNPNTPEELRQQLQSILLDIAGDPKGREILRQLGIDAFVRPDPAAYGLIQTMMQATGSL